MSFGHWAGKEGEHLCAFVPHDRHDTALMLLEARKPGVVLLTRDTRLLAHRDKVKIKQTPIHQITRTSED